jgi:hypothetical protein
MEAQLLAHGAVISMCDASHPAGIAPGSSDAPPETGIDAPPALHGSRKCGLNL